MEQNNNEMKNKWLANNVKLKITKSYTYLYTKI